MRVLFLIISFFVFPTTAQELTLSNFPPELKTYIINLVNLKELKCNQIWALIGCTEKAFPQPRKQEIELLWNLCEELSKRSETHGLPCVSSAFIALKHLGLSFSQLLNNIMVRSWPLEKNGGYYVQPYVFSPVEVQQWLKGQKLMLTHEKLFNPEMSLSEDLTDEQLNKMYSEYHHSLYGNLNRQDKKYQYTFAKDKSEASGFGFELNDDLFDKKNRQQRLACERKLYVVAHLYYYKVRYDEKYSLYYKNFLDIDGKPCNNLIKTGKVFWLKDNSIMVWKPATPDYSCQQVIIENIQLHFDRSLTDNAIWSKFVLNNKLDILFKLSAAISTSYGEKAKDFPLLAKISDTIQTLIPEKVTTPIQEATQENVVQPTLLLNNNNNNSLSASALAVMNNKSSTQTQNSLRSKLKSTFKK